MFERLGMAATAALLLASVTRAAEVGYVAQPALFGDRLVFASEGDLWTARLEEGGGPTIAYRLTSSDGAESWPVISADGTQIAFRAEYDGNPDVYVMPIDGGAPKRLTFHPGADTPLAWAPDGSAIYFRSSRSQPLGRDELWSVAPFGGAPTRHDVGPCTLLTLSATGRRFAFTPWSNESWSWKGYRGGTAPDIWVGDFTARTFSRLTDDPANDLFPMWMLGRVFFLSDRDGAFNVYSDAPDGGDLKQVTSFAPDPANPTLIAGYDVRWPRQEAGRRPTRIVFCQAGGLAILDGTNGAVTRLDVRLASDRVAARSRYDEAGASFREVALAPDGSAVVLGARGEIVHVDATTGTTRQLTRTGGIREWGVSWVDDARLALITDATGEQQIAMMPADGSEMPSLVTESREAWLFPPVASADGTWIAFADKHMRLNAVDMGPIVPHLVDTAEAGEITDYRFSPDGQWLAYVKPEMNGASTVHLHSMRTKRSMPVSTGRTIDSEPRWDPAGRYLYFLSEQHLDPLMGRLDFEHVYVGSTLIYAVPLQETTPPPLPADAAAAGFDLESWAKGGAEEEEDEDDGATAPLDDVDPFAPPAPGNAEPDVMLVDGEGLAARHVLLPVPPGNYSGLEAQAGAITFVSNPNEGLLDDDWPRATIAPGDGTLLRYAFVDAEVAEVVEGVDEYAMSADGSTIAFMGEDGLRVVSLPDAEAIRTIDLEAIDLHVDVAAEWRQMFAEAWRLQRDFYWSPTMNSVDWEACRAKYEALLPRIGSRAELNDLIGQMIGELHTSHTYVWGGAAHEREEREAVNVGLLGADIDFEGRITRILPHQTWDASVRSPLAAPHLGIREGARIVAIDGAAFVPGANVYELLQDKAGARVRLAIVDEDGGNRRIVEVEPLPSERELRYHAWVDANRAAVAAASDGRIGYVHVPDMGGPGLVRFSRDFYPQHDRPALVIDVRDNGGGFVSQMIIERLARRVIGYDQPRHGKTERYPYRAPRAHMIALIDQHAGSDGDIFANAFRAMDLGPLLGTRTWGGVVGIRGDKPFVDLGLSTQPEFAWWDEGGWTIENRGVSPDIEVEYGPADHAAGVDPQLNRAIEYLLRQLEADPLEPPKPPAYP